MISVPLFGVRAAIGRSSIDDAEGSPRSGEQATATIESVRARRLFRFALRCFRERLTRATATPLACFTSAVAFAAGGVRASVAAANRVYCACNTKEYST